MIHGFTANAVAAGEAGAAEAAVAVLRQRAAQVELARAACRMFGPLCQAPRNCVRAGSAGAIPLLVAALRTHGAAHADIAELAALALRQLTRDAPPEDLSANVAAAAAAGAAAALSAAMAMRPSHVGLLLHGCHALHCILRAPALPPAAGAAAIRGVLVALRSGDAGVAVSAVHALFEILRVPALDAAAGRTGAAAALLAVV